MNVPLLAEAGRRAGVVLLLAAVLSPATFTGLGETPQVRGPERAVLVAPDATQEMPQGRDTAGSPLVLLVPAGLLGAVPALPEPSRSRLALWPADRPTASAASRFVPPPPRGA